MYEYTEESIKDRATAIEYLDRNCENLVSVVEIHHHDLLGNATKDIVGIYKNLKDAIRAMKWRIGEEIKRSYIYNDVYMGHIEGEIVRSDYEFHLKDKNKNGFSIVITKMPLLEKFIDPDSLSESKENIEKV